MLQTSIADVVSRVEIQVAGVLIATALVGTVKSLLDVRTLKRESATQKDHDLLKQRVEAAEGTLGEVREHVEALGNVSTLVHELRSGFSELKDALSDLRTETSRQGQQIGFLVGLAKADTIVLRQSDQDKK